MKFLLNDLSVEGQFSSLSDFANAVENLMRIRSVIRSAGRELLCNRSLIHAKVTATQMMAQAIQAMPREKRLAWTQWITKSGPYWLDDREHSDDTWMQLSDGRIVTSTAIGEAAFCTSRFIVRHLVSTDLPEWQIDPLEIHWIKSDDVSEIVHVGNHWTTASVQQAIRLLPLPFDSWQTLEDFSKRTCEFLHFSEDAFETLRPHPYHHGAAERLLIRLNVLNRISGGVTSDGERTDECNDLLAMHFSGTKAWFTDSSPSEKNEFANELSFKHPTMTGEKIDCTWHGKVKTPQLRIHFSWPIIAGTRIFVPYAGPKLTKK